VRGEYGNLHTHLPACFVADKWEQPHSGVAKQHFLFAHFFLRMDHVCRYFCYAERLYQRLREVLAVSTTGNLLQARAASASSDQHSMLYDYYGVPNCTCRDNGSCVYQCFCTRFCDALCSYSTYRRISCKGDCILLSEYNQFIPILPSTQQLFINI
jgi:hypothetical protein